MSLPSQSSRNATRSSQVHYRRSSPGPIRRLFTIVVILALVGVLWFAFIRPRASKLAADQDQTNTDTSTNTNNEASLAQTTSSQPAQENKPLVIRNSPSRPLPGAGDRPDPAQEVEQTLASDAAPGTGRPLPSPAPSSPNTDILKAAIDQARPASTDQTRQTQTRQTQTQHEINNPAGIRLQLDTADRLIASNDRVGARKLLSKTLLSEHITHAQAQYLRDELTIINNQLLFSPVVDPNDPMTETYTIKSGDSLSKIAARRELATHWKLIARVNQIADPSKIRLGQNIKLVRGPFHAVVYKSAHRLDIFHGAPDDPDSWLFIRSFDVGLGSNDGTPVGDFVVSANKLENPGWVNPRDAREQYSPNDPDNPIGEYWIGITGVGKYSSLTSLGLHGTIDPDSIGRDESMGCVRLADGDIDVVYELLAEHISRVIIRP